VTRPSVLLLAVALAPLLVFAVAGASHWRRTAQDQILVLWPLAALAVYFVSTGYSPHALEGLPLPLTVLAVRGWQRMKLSAWLAIAAIVVATIPGAIFSVQLLREAAHADQQGMLLRPDETKALAFLAQARDAGGVLPSLSISTAVPAYTGRRTWIGHPSWTPHYDARARAVSDLFAGRLSAPRAQAFLRRVGARYLLADCETHFDPSRLGSLLLAKRQFGCVTVDELDINTRTAAL